jgi:hypothetical protein
VAARVLLGVAVGIGALLLPLAAPAGADPPRPGDFQSTVTGISPAVDGVEAVVIGGDALLQLTVAPGHEVTVPGYEDEPYLRFRADGTVQENRSSTTTYANASRYYDTELPDGVDNSGPPQWRTVADGGRYSWHDHRVHHMSTQLPAGVPRGSEVRDWEVPLVVDGEQVAVEGTLVLEPAVAWWPWLVVIVLVAAAVWVVGRSHRVGVPVVAGGVACLLVGGVAAVEQLSFPPEVGRVWVAVAVPALGLVAAAVAAALVWRGRARLAAGRTFSIVAASLAGGTAALRYTVLTYPVLPTDLAPGLDRAATAVALGLALGASATLVTRTPRPRPGSHPRPDTAPQPTAAEPEAVG